MEQDLVIRQAWPARRGSAAISPSEASKAFTRDRGQAAEVIALQPDRFFGLLQAGKDVARVLVPDPAKHVDSGCPGDGTAAAERAGA